MDERILTLFPPATAHARARFQVRPDLSARFIAHLEHRGLHVAGISAPDAARPSASGTAITLAPGTSLAFLATARDTFLAQIRR